MPKGGLEPPRPYGHCALNAARLPVPPLRHQMSALASQTRSLPVEDQRWLAKRRTEYTCP